MSRTMLGLIGVLVLAGAVWMMLPQDDDAATPPPAPPVMPEDPPDAGPQDVGPKLEVDGTDPADPEPTPEPEIAPSVVEPDVQPGQLVLVGRVVDPTRRPVAGAVVVLHRSDAIGWDRPQTRTAADGRFVFSGIELPGGRLRMVVHARAKGLAGHTGRGYWSTKGARIDVGTISIAPSSDLQAQVVDGDDKPVAGALVMLEASDWQSAAILDAERTGADGRCTLHAVAPKAYRVLASKAGMGRGVQPARVAGKGPTRVKIVMHVPRALVVIVKDHATTRPIANATLTIDEVVSSSMGKSATTYRPRLPELRTDAEGRVRIPGIGPDDELIVLATAEGYPPVGNSRMLRGLAKDKSELVILLHKLRTVRWPLSTTEGTRPADGTQLEIEKDPGGIAEAIPTRAWIEDGHIVAEGCHHGYFHVHFMAPDGSWAPAMGKQQSDEGAETYFRTQRQVRVTVRNADGSPAPDWNVTLRGGGNNRDGGPVLTDAAGVAEIPVRTRRERLNVFVGRDPNTYSGMAVGTVAMDSDTPSLTVDLPPVQAVELAITIEGRAALPPEFSLGMPAHDVEEDPDKGLVRFSVHQPPGQPLRVPVVAKGYSAANVLLPPPEGSVTRVALDFKRTGALLARVRPPPDGRMHLSTKAVDAKPGPPIFTTSGGPKVIGTDGDWQIVRVEGLVPGKHQLTERNSRAVSKAIDVPPGGESEVVVLDLGHCGDVHGTMEVPANFDLSQARIIVEGDDLLPAWGDPKNYAPRVWKSGKFRVRVPGDRKVTLKAWHPLLVPAREGGTLEVVKPVEGARLRLEAGSTATFRLDPTPKSSFQGTGVSVYLFKGPAEGEPFQRLEPVLADGTYTIAGFPAGTYTLAFSARQLAPTIVADVKLEDVNDLGTISLPPGSTVRIKIKVPEDQTPPRIYANVWAEHPFRYGRYINSDGEAEVLLRGLGKGRFRLRAHVMATIGRQGAPALDQVLEADGVNDVEVEMDLTK